MVLGKPAKIYLLEDKKSGKSVKVDLYTSTVIRKILGVTYLTFIDWEKNGFIPKPMFKAGLRRYYSSYEIRAFIDVLISCGRPKFFKGKETVFSKTLYESWKEIRASFKKYETPKQKIVLSFPDYDSYMAAMKKSMKVFGLTGEIQCEKVGEELLHISGML